jgi:DNA repair protein RecN (Recombination protein N)
MLRHLTIRDFVLVDRLELVFEKGFGALTGETGAGKSILVDAIAFALGERADSTLIRMGSERAEVVVEFDLKDAPTATEWLREHDLDVEEGALLLRRTVDTNGRSRAYLNGSPATIQQLRKIAESLIDIHGQHAHQSLLRGDAQRSLLDTHAGLNSLLAEVTMAWHHWRESKIALDTARGGIDALTQEREQLEWQISELEALSFSVDEWGTLNSEHRRLAHAAKLLEGAQYALEVLSEGDSSCENLVDLVASRLDPLVEYDPALAEVAQLLQSAQAELSEAVHALRRYADRAELDPQRLDDIEHRIQAVLGCARKFRSLPEDLPALYSRWRARLAELGAAADIAGLEARVAALQLRYGEIARSLSKERLVAATTLSADVSRVMQQLALGGGRFDICLVPIENGSAFGFEQVDFRIAGLAGNESRSLAKVASGGELSRISLAIQVVTSQAAQVPTLIFDEVDVGIGGGVAEVVGQLLRGLGSERQVLSVTHLPQVAACANWQWQVVKNAENGHIRSRVSMLNYDERVEEIARMLGGVEITAITRQHAREILKVHED